MVNSKIHFACGEFVPGKGIIKSPKPDLPIPPKVIPIPWNPETDIIFLPPPSYVLPEDITFPRPPGIPPAPPNRNPRNPGPGGPSTGGRGGPITPSGITITPDDGPRGPITQTPGQVWYCDVVREDYCPNGITLKSVQRQCKPLSVRDKEQFPGRTFYNSKTECQRNCTHEEWPCPTVGVERIPDDSIGSIPFAPDSVTLPPEIEISVSVPTIQSATAPQAAVVNVEEVVRENVTSDTEDVYDAEFNFFGFTQAHTGPVELVTNNLYRNIFKNSVTKEVAYLIGKHGNTSKWKEYPAMTVTNAKIALSINDELLQAFQAIHYQGGQLVNQSHFLGIVRYLLCAGKLDEFDPQFYIKLAARQKNDQFLILNKSTNLNDNLRVSLGYLSDAGKPLDFSVYPEDVQPVMSRIKTAGDVNPRVSLGSELCDSGAIPLTELGVQVCCDGGSTYVNEYPSDGHYFLGNCDGREFAIPITTDVSSTFFLTPEGRNNTLYLLDEATDLRLTASALDTSSELTTNYPSGIENPPELYFYLDTSTITEDETSKSVVNRYSGTYRLLTEEEDIINHSKLYGIMVSRVAVDYRDPFYVYASAAGDIHFTTADISLKNLSSSGAAINNVVLTKSAPLGLILTPGKGSAHNPFHGLSVLDSIEGTVQRTLRVMASIDTTDDEHWSTAIEEDLMYNKLGVFSLGPGGYADTQNVIYQYDSTVSSYYSGTTEDLIERKVIINTIQELIEERFDFNYLTWWDIYRRLNLNEFMQFNTETPSFVRQQLEKGYLGYLIKDVSGDKGSVSSGLTAVKNESIEDKIILNQVDRKELLKYDA